MNLTHRTRWSFISLWTLLMVLTLNIPLAAAHPASDLSPASATFTLLPGGTATEIKTIGVPAKPAKADIEIAVDTTNSMDPTIAQTKADATNIVAQVQAQVPDTQFAVVQFKDLGDRVKDINGNYVMEYVVMQPMTADSTAVQKAINVLSTGGGSDPPEAYNLVFHNSYTPATGGPIGWRTGSRKFVIVLGDAQPHGNLATQGFAGCADVSADPHGYVTKTELAGMAANERTLMMLRRQVGLYISASLQCYQSLTGSGYIGGQAADVGSSLVSQILAMIDTTFTTVGNIHLEVASAGPAPADASWISFSPAALGPLSAPSTQTINLTMKVPAGTPSGTYNFDIVALADGVDIGHQALTINVDGTPPTTQANVAPPPASGWYTDTVQVSLNAVDNLSGVDKTYYQVDGGPTQVYSAPFSDTQSGTHTITFWSVDTLGNVETSQSITLKIDTTAPTITGAATTSPNAEGWYNGPVTVHFTCTDADSGIASCPADMVLPTAGTNQSVTGTTTDNAGNTASVTVSGINIDTTNPTITGTATTSPNAEGWYNGPVTVHFTCTDADSGIASCPADMVLSTAGTNQSVTGTTTDNAGNTASVIVSGINIDTTNPTITGTTTTNPNPSGWYNGPVTVHFTCADALSGLATCPADVVLSKDGANQSVTDTATDNASNTANVTVSGINIDTTNPTITGAATTSPNANGWYNGPVTVHFTCADALSGIATCPTDVVLSTDGVNQSASGTASDNVGNTASVTVSGINIDTTKPTISSISVTNGAVYTLGSVPAASCTATDAGAGLDGTCSVKVIGGNADGSGTFTFTATATDKAGNTTTQTGTYQVNIPIVTTGIAQITPTGTTCDQFKSGTSATLSTLQYGVKSGSVSPVSPGVFFYWLKVTASTGSNTFTINQTITTGNYTNHFFNHAAGSNVFDSSCAAAKPTPTISTSNGVTTVSFNASAAGTYIISIKYDSKSVEDFNVPNPTTVHYNIETKGVASSKQGLDLVKK